MLRKWKQMLHSGYFVRLLWMVLLSIIAALVVFAAVIYTSYGTLYLSSLSSRGQTTAAEICGGLEVRPVAISVPGEFREYCRELFGGGLEMAEASHDLFANRTNGRLYRRLVEPYIMGERRL